MERKPFGWTHLFNFLSLMFQLKVFLSEKWKKESNFFFFNVQPHHFEEWRRQKGFSPKNIRLKKVLFFIARALYHSADFKVFLPRSSANIPWKFNCFPAVFVLDLFLPLFRYFLNQKKYLIKSFGFVPFKLRLYKIIKECKYLPSKHKMGLTLSVDASWWICHPEKFIDRNPTSDIFFVTFVNHPRKHSKIFAIILQFDKVVLLECQLKVVNGDEKGSCGKQINFFLNFNFMSLVWIFLKYFFAGRDNIG